MAPSIGWNFPSNNNGREDGLNDPGIETFRDDPLRSLSREGPQNTADAADPGSEKAVEIHFELIDLPMSRFPDADRFQETLKRCAKYWDSNQAARKFIRNALKVMKGDSVRVLRMADYNTTGLLGPVDDRTSDWFKLTKAVGSSDKAGGAGGSFGIGKHAPFACSELRTVLYGTKDKYGEFAFQGVSKLVTHVNGKDETTQGTGYYGIKSKNAPIADPTLVDKMFRRTRIGTDVFILGFLHEKDWEDKITKGLLESFFVSIHEGRLLARVGSVPLNRNSLPGLIEKYARGDRNWAARSYYQALTSEDASLFHEDDFEGLGRIELRLLSGKEYPKRVAMVRSSGMKIFDKGHFQTPLRFAGVFTAGGGDLNALLKSLEPPSHDKWSDERAEDPAGAKSVLRNLYGWVNDKVRSMSELHGLEELDAEGVSQYLPDDLDDSEQPTDSAAEGERTEPQPDISVQVRLHETPVAVAMGADTPAADGGEEITLGGPGNFGGGGDGGGGDGGGGTEGGGGGEGTTKGGSGRGSSPTSKPIGLRKVRVYCSDPKVGRYRIMAEPEATTNGFLLVHVIGEVGQEAAPIQQIWLPGTRDGQPPPKPGAVGPLELETGKRISVDVVLEGALHCALGVSAYAA
jgi:uncharacterized membrane protein YgcG